MFWILNTGHGELTKFETPLKFCFWGFQGVSLVNRGGRPPPDSPYFAHCSSLFPTHSQRMIRESATSRSGRNRAWEWTRRTREKNQFSFFVWKIRSFKLIRSRTTHHYQISMHFQSYFPVNYIYQCIFNHISQSTIYRCIFNHISRSTICRWPFNNGRFPVNSKSMTFQHFGNIAR